MCVYKYFVSTTHISYVSQSNIMVREEIFADERVKMGEFREFFFVDEQFSDRNFSHFDPLVLISRPF